MAKATTLKKNLTVVGTVNNDSVSKEETIMGTTTMNNDVVVIEFAVAEQLKDRLNVEGIHSEGYLGKAEIGEILGLSKKKVTTSKREELLNVLKLAIEEAYHVKKYSDEGDQLEMDETGVDPTAKKSSKKAGTKKDSKKDTKKESKKTTKKETKETKSEKSNLEKTKELYEKMNNTALANEEKGFGRCISSFMLQALILEQYGVYNLKGAMKNDELTRKSGQGRIILTDDLKAKYMEIKKWLINVGKIKPVIYTANTNKNYYMKDLYDGKYASSMTELTEVVWNCLDKDTVKVVSYKVF